MTQETKVPVDTTAGGAAKLKNLKINDPSLKGLNLIRTSSSIARQELLSYARMICRDCFNGQLSDPVIHMDHDGDTSTPARFWLNRVGGMEHPFISYTKARLLTQTIPQMWPDLKRCMVHYWIWKETGKEGVDEDSEEFQLKVKYVEEHADPRFIREASEEDSNQTLEKRSKLQEFADEWLETLAADELKCLCTKNKEMSTLDRQTKKTLIEGMEERHRKLMGTLPQKLRFLTPPNQMIKKRAQEKLKTKS